MNPTVKALVVLGPAALVGAILLFGLGGALLPLFIAFSLAYLSFPLIRYAEKRGIQRQYAVVGVFISIAAILSLVAVLLIPALIEDGREFLRVRLSPPAR